MIFNRYTELQLITNEGETRVLRTIDPDSMREELDIHFRVESEKPQSGDVATITVWNLDDETLETYLVEGNRVVLTSGYYPPDGTKLIGPIFAGVIKRKKTSYDRGNLKVEFTCTDLTSTLKFYGPTEITTYTNIKWSAIIRDLINKAYSKTGVAVGNIDTSDNGPQEPYIIDASTDLLTIIKDIAEEARVNGKKMYLTLFQGTVNLTKEPYFPGVAYLLTYETGLLDIRQYNETNTPIKKQEEESKYEIELFLIPNVSKGTVLQIKNTPLVQDEFFKILKYTFISNDNEHKCKAIIQKVTGVTA